MPLDAPPSAVDIWQSPSLATADSEQALLGSILVNNAVLDRVCLIVNERDFSYPLHGRMYDLIAQLAIAGKPADLFAVNRALAEDDTYKAAGGSKYLAAILECANPHFSEHYARRIADASARRSLIAALQSATVDAANPGELRDFAAVIDEHESALALLRNGVSDERGPVPMADAVEAAVMAAEAVYKAGGAVMGITTGLADLDRAIGGMHRTDMLVIAGRPGMGKSALATTIAEAAAGSGKRVYFSSLEMSADQIAARQLAAASGISVERQRNGPLTGGDIDALADAGGILRRLPIMFDDMMVSSVETLRGKLKRHKRRHGLDLVVVDYLQLIEGGGGRPDNRVQEVSAITRGLKGIAKDLEVPVVALSQLSRAVEQRDDKRPYLSDLRDSGSIEQDADIVMFLYREEYYAQREEPQRKERETADAYATRVADWSERCDKCRNLADIIIGKNRHGSTRTVQVRFDAERTAFSNVDRRW